MPNTDENIQKTEEFIRNALKNSFGQEVDKDILTGAATKLRRALPEFKAHEAA
jgi:triosephosphate isomerase